MGREVRRVPADWQHPRDEHSNKYKPLFEGRMYEEEVRDFMLKLATEGLQAAIEWCGSAPDANDYMPNWPADQRTHLMMYEDTSEGTPISPAFETPEELARWLADSNASSFGSSTATYEQWLSVARGGWAPSLVISAGVMRSGVEDAANSEAPTP